MNQDDKERGGLTGPVVGYLAAAVALLILLMA